MVAFGYDSRGQGGFDPKVMVRCLLFSTGERGHVIETLFARLTSADSKLPLNTWGILQEKLERGGGLFVGKQGVPAWHHFVASGNQSSFRFGAGKYQLEVLGRVHGFGTPLTLWSTTLVVPDSAAPLHHDGRDPVWFDLDPDSGEFVARLESRGAGGSMPAS
jgi:hypothetical protein